MPVTGGFQPTWKHAQQPRNWGIVLARGGLALLVLLGIVWFTQWRQRITTATIQHDVAARLHAPPARCADHSGNGSVWACLVGPAPRSRCVVVDVSLTGRLSFEHHPRHCRYP